MESEEPLHFGPGHKASSIPKKAYNVSIPIIVTPVPPVIIDSVKVGKKKKHEKPLVNNIVVPPIIVPVPSVSVNGNFYIISFFNTKSLCFID